MTDTQYLLALIVIMAGVTFATRAFPFVALKGRGDHPTLDFIGRYMPPAVMTILVLYTLKSVDLSTPPYGAVEIIALLITTAFHLWKGNSLLSIFAGTAFYMAALQHGLLQ